jgi:hypothetical protein
MKNKNRIILAYDRVVADSPIPNGISIEILADILKSYGEINFTHDYVDTYHSLYNIPSAFQNYMLSSNLPDFEIRPTMQVYRDYCQKMKYPFLYIIESYGKFSRCLGYEEDPELYELLEFDEIENDKSFFKNINKNILEVIKNNDDAYILLNHSHEGDVSEDDIILMKLLLKKYDIPDRKFIYIHNSFGMDIPFDNYKFDWHLAAKSIETQKLKKENLLNENCIFNKPNKFHFPIRRFREYRIKLLEQLFLYDNKFIKNNAISYDLDCENNRDSILDLDKKFQKYLLKNKKQIVDVDDVESIHGYRSEYKEPYESSYITIVAETIFKEKYNYISEKTWKPIAHQHPFIMVGRPGILKYLREIGFKTFSPFIDESYDDEIVTEKRFKIIVGEIKRLNSLSKEQLDDMIKSLNESLEHNQNLLIKLNEAQNLERNYLSFVLNKLYQPKKEITEPVIIQKQPLPAPRKLI